MSDAMRRSNYPRPQSRTPARAGRCRPRVGLLGSRGGPAAIP